MALSEKQRRFADEYLIDLNATQAAIRAGYSKKTARAIAHENLTKLDIQTYLTEARKKLSEATKITPERVLNELAKIGFFDVRKLVDDTGAPKRITDLDDDTAAAIAGIDVVQIGNSEAGIGAVLKYKIANKESALVSIGKHLGMFKERVEHTGKNGGPIETKDLSENDLARRVAFILTKATKQT